LEICSILYVQTNYKFYFKGTNLKFVIFYRFKSTINTIFKEQI
jgi:hypothetical protein